MNERRRAPRRPAQAQAYLIDGDGPHWRCRLTNIGAHGARIEPPPPDSIVGKPIELAVVLRVDGVVRLRRVRAVIANTTRRGLGVEFQPTRRPATAASSARS
jgi:hypothetical protein